MNLKPEALFRRSHCICYTGKGKKPRMNRSARQRFTQDVNDPKTAKPDLCVHRDFGDDIVALMVEHLLIERFNATAPLDEGGCFNQINSFGAKLYNNKLTDEQRKKYRVTPSQRKLAAEQAEEMINDIQIGKCLLKTACFNLKFK